MFTLETPLITIIIVYNVVILVCTPQKRVKNMSSIFYFEIDGSHPT